MAPKANWTLTQIINQLDSGYKWNVAPGGTITWGTPTSPFDYYGTYENIGISKLSNLQKQVVAQTLSLWSDVANIKFQYVGNTANANLKFQNSSAMGDAYAWAYYPGQDRYSGSVWFSTGDDLQNPKLSDVSSGGWAFMAYVHEIGHALGLEHMGNYDASQGGPITYATHASSIQDSMLYSIMSYFTAEDAGQADWKASDGNYYVSQTLMMNDIAAIQKIYGVNTTTRLADTVYGFNASAGLDNVYNFNINKHPVLCLYDSGGIDTLDLSGFSSSSNVNLLAGTFSDCDEMTKNISIARNVIIENATTGAGHDTISGNAVNNILIGNAGNDVLNGLAGHDQLFGGSGNDVLDGGAGNDRLDGGSANDRMSGGTGNDLYIVDSAGDLIFELAAGGIDTVESTISVTQAIIGTQVENIILLGTAKTATGNDLNNTITGNAEDNELSGGAGNDRLDGGIGNDRMNGGTGNDFYFVDSAGDFISEFAAGGIDTVESTVSINQDIIGTQVENIILKGTAKTATGNGLNNILTGNAEDNVLSGGAGNDTLLGGEGHDTLDGGTGNDSMTGGAGDDIYFIDSSRDTAVETAGGGNDTVISSTISLTLGQHIENATLQGDLALNATGNAEINRLTGNSASNVLIGGAGNDFLFGGAGDDRLDGGVGADQLDGGIGNDTYLVDNIGDRITETSNGIDTVISSINFTLSANLENLSLTGTAITGTGNNDQNVIIGNNAANLLYGGAGNDTLNGGSGADQLFGGDGDDLYEIDNAGDRITEQNGEGTDTVLSSVTVTTIMIGDHVENIQLTGRAAINATGNASANIITGNANANTLNGEAGNDILDGGAGNDRLFGGADSDTLNGGIGNDLLDGGAGMDIFLFSTALGRGNIDTIQNFSVADDTIHLESDIFTMLSTNLSDTFGTLLIYNSSTGALSYDADGTGTIAAIQFAILSRGLTLTAADFVII